MKSFISSFLILISITAFAQTNNEMEQRKAKIQSMERQGCNEEQSQRKAASMAYCQSKEVPTIESLPCIESENDVEIRTKDEIVKRALALLYLGLKSEGVEKKTLDRVEATYDIRPNFSPVELKYVDAENPDRQQQVNANWRYESLHVLLWALGYVKELSYPANVCDVKTHVGIIAQRSLEIFTEQAKLRSKKEILDQADLIYRLHWAVVNARIKGEESPGKLNGSVVYERHYVLNWLINYMNQAWDDVSTDT